MRYQAFIDKLVFIMLFIKETVSACQLSSSFCELLLCLSVAQDLPALRETVPEIRNKTVCVPETEVDVSYCPVIHAMSFSNVGERTRCSSWTYLTDYEIRSDWFG